MQQKHKKIFFAAATLVGLIAFAEIASYIVLKILRIPGADQSKACLYSVYRCHKLNPQAYHGHHSAQGFREDSLISKRKAPATFRIFAFGGSTMYGLGHAGSFVPPLKNSENIDSYLEKLLNARLAHDSLAIKKIEIINAALPAYQPFQHMIYINEIIADFDADMYLFLDGHNDFYTAKLDYNSLVDYPYHTGWIMESLNSPSLLLCALVVSQAAAPYSNCARALFCISHHLTVLVQKKNAQKRLEMQEQNIIPTESLDSLYERYAGPSFMRAYKQIRGFCADAGIDMLVFLQPEIEMEDPGLLSAKDKEIQVREIRTKKPGRPARLQAICSLAAAQFEKSGIAFHSLGTIAGKSTNDRQLYIDACHLTPEGNEHIARLMADVLWPCISSRCARTPSMQP